MPLTFADWLRCCDVQAMLKDGGLSFECAQSSAWRKDSECHEPSDFMTAGERFGQLVPAVPQGFVRLVQLRKVNDRHVQLKAKRKVLTVNGTISTTSGGDRDRDLFYVYCGEGGVVPDTAGWDPACECEGPCSDPC
jgi:hypothetical protein